MQVVFSTGCRVGSDRAPDWRSATSREDRTIPFCINDAGDVPCGGRPHCRVVYREPGGVAAPYRRSCCPSPTPTTCAALCDEMSRCPCCIWNRNAMILTGGTGPHGWPHEPRVGRAREDDDLRLVSCCEAQCAQGDAAARRRPPAAPDRQREGASSRLPMEADAEGCCPGKWCSWR